MSVSLSYRNLGIGFLSLGKIKDNLSKSAVQVKYRFF